MKKNIFGNSVLVIFMCLMMSLSLAACTGGSGNSLATPFSQTVSGEGIRIWYECQNKISSSEGDSVIIEGVNDNPGQTQFGRETRVVWIKVYENGKLTTYSCNKNVYLGYFAKLTDEEIVNELKTNKDKFICGQEEQDYQIYLYSDASGSEIMYEGVPAIIYQKSSVEPMYFMTLMSGSTIETFKVYDSYYGGYELYNYDEVPFAEACIITRCDQGTSFGLDSLDLEGAVVDYDTPEDLLNELNAELSKSEKGQDEESEMAEDTDGDSF